jgi:hypothetical protein
MVRFFKWNRTSRLRAVRVYLVIILACTLLLFCFNIVSLYEQSRKVEELSTSNLRLLGDQIASDIERRLEFIAADCLSKQNLESLSYMPGREGTFDRLRAYRKHFASLAKMYPVARSFFVMDRDGLVFPRVSPLSPQVLSPLVSSGQSGSSRMYLQLLSQAKHLEVDLKLPARAAEVYRSAEKLDVNARLKAYALLRRAQSLEKANKEPQAVESYQSLLKNYADEYDEYGVPYILALAVAPKMMAQKISLFAQQSPHKIYQDLINGKWELSADQTEQFMEDLEERLQLDARDRQTSDFLYGFQLAKAVREHLQQDKHLTAFEVTPQSFEHKSILYQTYRVFVPSDKGQNITVGFSVSIPWVTKSLLPACIKDARYRGIGSISVVEGHNYEPAPVSDAEALVSFPTILPGMKLRVSSEAPNLKRADANRETLYVGFASILLLCAMGLGLKLFIRVSWDIRWFQLRSDFVSGVSHEFKTPLSLIRLYSETLATNDQEFSSEDRNNYIRIIARESERMSRLVDNVLSFANLERGGRRYEMREGDLGVTVTQVVNDYSEYLSWQGFYVKCALWPDLPRVRFNPEQVSEMLVNLMDNARKYSGSSRQIRVNLWIQNRDVVVEVRDHGIGIPAEETEKIFQPFYRIPRSGEQGGCGLGLYLVDQAMKQHGGRVEVESQENHGSRFRLIFPASGNKMVKAAKKNTHEFTDAQFERQI